MKKYSLETYAKLCVEFYDLEQHPNHMQALDFYMKYALQAVGPVLEPMCGSGRFFIPMLEKGIDIEGFDASIYMIDALKRKCADIGIKKVPVSHQFIQEFTSSKSYSLIFIPYGSWGLVTDRLQAECGLERMYRCLMHGGKLVVEIETVSSVPLPCGVLRRAVRKRADGSLLALSFVTSYNEKTQIFQSFSHYESIVNNCIQEREEELFEQYLYRFNEFEAMLYDVGFVEIKKFPAFNCTQKAGEDTPIIIYECLK